MLDFFQKLFRSDFMPHGHCFLWRQDILALHVGSDALTALSYYLIPFGLIWFVRRRKDLTFHYHWVFVLFGLFILSCGTTHLMAIWTLWHGTYRLEGVIKLVTALSSFPTAILLLRLLPQAVKVPSPEQLAQINAELERRVRERTVELQETNRRLVETNDALRAANSDLRHFAHSASHDLQEPLRMVSLYSQMLVRRLGDKLDDESRQYLAFSSEGARRMSAMIGDILAYTELGTESSQPRIADGDAAMRAVSQNLAAAIRESGAQVSAAPLPAVAIPQRRLEQVLQNLVSNAIKYQHPGATPVVRVSARRDGAMWEFAVEDNGIGIDPRYHDTVFQLFKRLHNRSEYAGSGIGLGTVRRIVDRFGGRVWIESEEGKGAIFRFTVPAAPGDGGA